MNIDNELSIQDEIKKLEEQIDEANPAYRKGEPIVPDSVYDGWIDRLGQIDPKNKRLAPIGFIPDSNERKQVLPVPMASMTKVKNIEIDFKKWLKTFNIPSTTLLVCTPKFDGLALCVDEKNQKDAWSGGDDGINGQYSPQHYVLLQNRNNDKRNLDFFTIGEVIMLPEVFEKGKFLKEDGEPFANPRNLVAGKINDKTPRELLKHCMYVRYGLFSNSLKLNKAEQIDLLNEVNPIQVPYVTIQAGDIDELFIYELFKKWNPVYGIDGIIAEINDYQLREDLGRESSSNNPNYARAIKLNFEDVADTEVLNLHGEISKQGYLKPTVALKPVSLNGATVSNPTGYNYRFIRDKGIGVGAIVRVIRSGMVVPKIIEVIKAVPFVMPTECPSCKGELEWNESGVEICCMNVDCEAQRLKKIIAFFEILEVPEMGEGVCEQLYNAGYDTIAKILNMSISDMLALDGFGSKKSEKLYTNIKKAVTDVPLSKLQHASGCFQSLGSKKLELLTEFNENSTIAEIVQLDGFSETLANNYLKGIVKFNKFIAALPVTIQKKTQQVITGDKCKGWSVVFTGFTNKDMESYIRENGGEIGSDVSKKTSHLVMKKKGSGSGKETKAIKLTVPIFDEDEFKALIQWT